MKGTNTLKLNQETMCEALQTWIDGQFASMVKPKVTKVEQETTGGIYGSGQRFSVTVATDEPAK